MFIEKNGVHYEVAAGYEWFWNQFANNSWEPNTFKVFDRFLEKDRNYLDIGAWIGPTVLYAASKAKNVYAFEPDQVAFSSLKRNIELNNIENVVAYPVAVSNLWKKINFGACKEFGDSMSSEIWSSESGNVPAISLFSIIHESNPGLIKIDIEGGEKFIFEGALIQMALKAFRPTIYLSLHTPWFKDDLESYKKTVMEGLFEYPYFYTDAGRPIALSDAFDPERFTTVVASYKLEI